MKKIFVLLVVGILLMSFSTAFAGEYSLDELQKMIEEMNELLGLESNLHFEMNGFTFDFKGSCNINEQTEESIDLDLGGASIYITKLDPKLFAIEDEYVDVYGVEAVTNAVLAYLKLTYSEYDCKTYTNSAGIEFLYFTQFEDYAGIGIAFAVYGNKLNAISVVVTSNYAEYMEYDLQQYLPEKMNSIFSGIGLISP